MVRVFKNMRNTMIEKGLLADGVAPSYFIEGMLSNVPNDKFAGTIGICGSSASTRSSRRTNEADDSEWPALARARKTSVCWPSADFHTFTAALKGDWES